jgi:hypothetical protein
MTRLPQDIRFALRSLRRRPAFTLVAVLTLAIGIGANTAIFSVTNAALFRPLPFPESERLMRVSLLMPDPAVAPGVRNMVWSFPKYRLFRNIQKAFASSGIYTAGSATVSEQGDAERVSIEIASAGYFATLGLRPQVGRLFLPDEDENPGTHSVAVLSHNLWRRRFASEPNVAGLTVTINGSRFDIVGVLPPGFNGLTGEAELWVPVTSPLARSLDRPRAHQFDLVARLAPGTTPDLARRLPSTSPFRPGCADAE